VSLVRQRSPLQGGRRLGPAPAAVTLSKGVAVPHRVTLPVTLDVGWVLTVPETCVGEARPASAASLRDLESSFAPTDEDDDEVDWFELLSRYAFACGTPEPAE
jgi:hypothetical protein